MMVGMKNPSFITLALLTVLAASASSQTTPDWGATASESASGALAGIRAMAAGAEASRKAEAARGIDLGEQFADPAQRNQSAVGSCHIFGSIGVLEAAYFRKYGKHVRFSEEDLFLRRQILSGDIYADFCASGKCTLSEGGHPSQDIQYALDHGVLTGSSYAAFVERYVRYRSAEQKTMEGLQKMRDQQGWLEKLLYDPRAHWRELQTQGSAAKMIGDYLEGRDRNSSTEREKTQKELAGFRVKVKWYEAGGNDTVTKTAAQCNAEGALQRGAMLRELHAGRPVVLSMNLIGLKAWGQTEKSRDAYHAFMIVGVKNDGGKRTFKSRNSWGGDNPDVGEDELCRVYGITTVLIPGEKETF